MTIHTPAGASRWPAEPGTGRGRSHGTSSSAPFDRWFRYPAGFASDYVGMLLDALGLESGTVLDCFAGSGVTGTAARARGLGFAGIEAHPLIAELAQLKLAPVATGAQVRALATTISDQLENAPTDVSDASRDEPELVRRSFSAPTLAELVRIRSLLREHAHEPAAPYLKWALLASLRDVANVKVGWPYQRPGVERRPRHSNALGRFAVRAECIAADLEEAGSSTAPAQVLRGDSQDPAVWAKLDHPAAASVASPPYLNNFDYADATRLELYFWGEVTSWKEMTTQVRDQMITATTQQSSRREKQDAVEELTASPTTANQEILELAERISDVKNARARRSKEYDQVVPAYFIGMSRILSNLHGHLAAGGTACWLVGDSAPYGVYVDTPGIIGRLAEQIGFEYTEDVVLRRRGNRWGNNPDRHDHELTERLIVFRKS